MSRSVQEKVSQEYGKSCNSLQMGAVVEGTIKLIQDFYFNLVTFKCDFCLFFVL